MARTRRRFALVLAPLALVLWWEARARREAEERWFREIEADPEATLLERQKAHDRAFRAGAWQAPGDAIVQALTGATVSGDRSPAQALKRQGLAPGLHYALEAGAGRRENWVAVTEPDGNQYHRLKAPLNPDGTLGAGTAKASPGCANLFNLFTNLDAAALSEFDEDGSQAAAILFPALVCVDVDPGAASPVTLSTPSFSGRHMTTECLSDGPCNAPRAMIRDGIDAAAWDFLSPHICSGSFLRMERPSSCTASAASANGPAHCLTTTRLPA